MASEGAGVPPGTVAPLAQLIGGVYVSAGVVLSGATQQVALQVDSTGSLKTAIQGAVSVTGTIGTAAAGVTWTDRTVTSSSGAPTLVAAANPTRKGLLLQNPSTLTGTAFFSLIAAAATSGGSSFELLPGGAYDPAGGAVATGSITVWTATAQRFIAAEGA